MKYVHRLKKSIFTTYNYLLKGQNRFDCFELNEKLFIEKFMSDD